MNCVTTIAADSNINWDCYCFYLMIIHAFCEMLSHFFCNKGRISSFVISLPANIPVIYAANARMYSMSQPFE